MQIMEKEREDNEFSLWFRWSRKRGKESCVKQTKSIIFIIKESLGSNSGLYMEWLAALVKE